MADIFLSYSRKDIEAVRPLAEWLVAQGWSVFWDLEIPTSRRWREVIERQLEAARLVVVVWSPAARASRWVLEEAEHGLEQNALFPLCLDGHRPPLGFRSLQALDIGAWDPTAEVSRRLVSDLTRRLGVPTGKPSSGPVTDGPSGAANKPGSIEEIGSSESLSVTTVASARELDPRPSWERRLGEPLGWASEVGEDEHGVYALVEVGAVRFQLRRIEAGSFWMGSPEDEDGRFDGEVRHRVMLTEPYWLGATPCTQPLWTEVMGSNPSRFKGAERPVENVSWAGAQAFLERLNKRVLGLGTRRPTEAQREQNPGRFKGANRPVENVSWDDAQGFLERLNARVPGLVARLPTEAQWEHGCRAGTEASRYAEPLEAIAWFDGNSGGETRPVGQKDPNRWGLGDTLGNVWEWCHDGRRAYDVHAQTDPVGPMERPKRVVRGGSWCNLARSVRAADRDALHRVLRNGYLGFRVSRGPGAP